MKVAVAMLNWNGFEDTLECIESLEKSTYTDFDIIVLDNGSTDGSLEELKKLKDRIKLFNIPENLGFTGGANRLVKEVFGNGYEIIFLINNDIILAEDCIQCLVEEYNRQENTYVLLAPRMYYYDSPKEIWHDGHLWNDTRGDFIPIENTDRWIKDGVNRVDHIIGTGMFFSRKIYENYGLFDERFFLNYEETDWEFRLKQNGVKLYTVSKAKIWHKISKTFTHSVYSTFYCERNRLLFIEKNYHGIKKFKILMFSEVPKKVSILLKMMRRFFGRYFYKLIGNMERYEHTRVKYLDNKMAIVAWGYYLRRKFGKFDGDFNEYK